MFSAGNSASVFHWAGPGVMMSLLSGYTEIFSKSWMFSQITDWKLPVTFSPPLFFTTEKCSHWGVKCGRSKRIEVSGEFNFTIHPGTWERRKGPELGGQGWAKAGKAAESLGVRAVTVPVLGLDLMHLTRTRFPPNPKLTCLKSTILARKAIKTHRKLYFSCQEFVWMTKANTPGA